MIVFLTKNTNVVNLFTGCLRRAKNGYYYIVEKDVYVPPILVEKIISDGIPEDIAEGKYCYTPEEGFYRNPNYVEPDPYGIPEELVERIKNDAIKEVEEAVINADE